MKNLLISCLISSAFCSASAHAASQGPNTSLLLRFENNANGAAGETPTTNSGLSYVVGLSGQAALLGNPNQLIYSRSGNIDPRQGTLEFWIKPEWAGNDGQDHMILKMGGGGGILMGKDSANNWRCIFNLGGANGQPEHGVGFNIGTWQAGEWQHAAFAWGAGQLRLYLDGELKASTAVPELPDIASSTTTFQLGGDGSGSYINATIDELRLSSVPLTELEIQQNYFADIPGMTALAASPATWTGWAGEFFTPELTTSSSIGPKTVPTELCAWSTSNAAVATVDATGRILAAGAGTASVTATLGGRSAVITVTVNAPTALVDGVPASGLAGEQGSTRYFDITVPAGVRRLRLETSGGTGNADLFARRGAPPTTSIFDYGSNTFGNAEVISVARPEPGVWKVLLSGWSAYTGVTLRVVMTYGVDTPAVDLGFDPLVNGPVNVFRIQPDGKVLIGGYFGSVGGVLRQGLARLNADGTLDESFAAVLGNGSGWMPGVEVIALQADGKMLVGGSFSTVNGVSRNRMARLNSDGSLDAGFTPPLIDGSVVTMVAANAGKVLIGGFFTTVGGFERYGLARLNVDGTLDQGYSAYLEDFSGNLVVGGGAVVGTLVPQANGKLLVSGYFATADGVARRGFARLNENGSLDADFLPPPGSDDWGPYKIAVQGDGRLVIADWDQSTNTDRIARLNADGSLDGNFLESVTNDGGWVSSMVEQPDGKILVAGTFRSLNGSDRSSLARLNNNGTLDGMMDPSIGVNNPWGGLRQVAIQQPSGAVLLAGDFNEVNGQPRSFLARLNGGGGAVAPSLHKNPAANLTHASATLGGNVTNDGGATITERGVVYSATATNPDPLIGGAGVTKVTAAGSTGTFNLLITGLTQGTSYSFKGYATNSQGTTYTSAGSFIALSLRESWRQTHFGITANAGNAADDADPDGDGLKNLLEYALNLPPTAASRVPASVAATGGNLEYTYTRGTAAFNGGMAYQVEWSNNLTTWSGADVVETMLSDDGTIQQVKATLPSGSGGRRFVRLRVIPPAPLP